ncbi:MAG: LysM peptidoglycan-binding domain-containing protein [Scytonematopsis contorta HA4267-MV1]|jgi:hypothetical protein|nr:LysM peptidoglycan-binding domain-containing protein [Scytonematopsis contorta HA4267-MV1]
MALEKMKIAVEEERGEFGLSKEVLFNPNQLTIAKTGWNEKDGKLVPNEDLSTLDIDFFFDTTFGKYPQNNVRNETKFIRDIVEINGELKRPPMCKLIWGAGDIILMQGVLMSINETLTHFLENGTPVRAILKCKFKNCESNELKQKKQNPIDDPIRIVKRGETLSSIAAQEYNDPSLWRIIAVANRLTDPRGIKPGQSLTVPPLRLGLTIQ